MWWMNPDPAWALALTGWCVAQIAAQAEVEAQRSRVLLRVESRWNAAELPIVLTDGGAAVGGGSGAAGHHVLEEGRTVALMRELRASAAAMSSMLHASNPFAGEFTELRNRLREAANILDLWLEAQGECLAITLVLESASLRRCVEPTQGHSPPQARKTSQIALVCAVGGGGGGVVWGASTQIRAAPGSSVRHGRQGVGVAHAGRVCTPASDASDGGFAANLAAAGRHDPPHGAGATRDCGPPALRPPALPPAVPAE